MQLWIVYPRSFSSCFLLPFSPLYVPRETSVLPGDGVWTSIMSAPPLALSSSFSSSFSFFFVVRWMVGKKRVFFLLLYTVQSNEKGKKQSAKKDHLSSKLIKLHLPSCACFRNIFIVVIVVIQSVFGNVGQLGHYYAKYFSCYSFSLAEHTLFLHPLLSPHRIYSCVRHSRPQSYRCPKKGDYPTIPCTVYYA